MTRLVIAHGAFDPLHVGHVRYLQEAKLLGADLMVIVYNDNWLMKKKGYFFMPEKERTEIVHSIDGIDIVMLTKHQKDATDLSLCTPLAEIHKETQLENIQLVVAYGQDGTESVAERELCEALGIQMIFGVGGEKVRSSRELVRNGRTAEKFL